MWRFHSLPKRHKYLPCSLHHHVILQQSTSALSFHDNILLVQYYSLHLAHAHSCIKALVTTIYVIQLVTAFRFEVSFLSWKHLLRRLWQLTLIGLRNNDTAKKIFSQHSLIIGISDSGIFYPSTALLWYSTTYFIYLTFTFASCFDESSFQPSLSLSLLVNISGHFTFISATLRSTHLLPSISTNNILSSFHRCLLRQHVQVFPSFSASSRNPLLHPNLAMTQFYALLHPWLLLPLILPSLSSIHRHLLFY